MAKIDDSVKKKVPELRFAGFADDWEERNLGEWSDVRDGTHASPKYIKQGHPMVTSKNLTDSGLDMSDVSYLTDEDFNEINQRSKVDIGDILFGMIGTIGKPVIVDRDDFAIKNVALIKEKTSPEIINTWLIQYLKSPSFERFIQKENAGGTQKFIALGLIRDMKLMTPSVQEQARIGELLNHLDNLIVANQHKLDLLKEQKKGYLQKMFPKNGAKVPELRFAGFADDWEERKLGQYTKLITKGTTPKDKTGIGDVNFVKVENITNGKIYPINKIKQNEHDNYLKRSRLEEKDILFSIAGTLGRTAIVNKSILPANTNQALAIIRGYDFDTNFLITSLSGNVVKEYIRRNPTVGAQPNLSLEQVGNLLVNTPNAEEQQKIGSFFKQLDDTIALHQRKLDLLKEQKKGFLQKIFV
ncbi:restriction endonuclease subunit S (plasmid) [Lactococcus sp. LG1267]|uniref:restriction endonuclease subunit S n=1 Tax=Lactococcus sp. LG1267 TaxID=2816910 RepID=UPI001A8D9C5D|nr:restriction endonuclease subunit S [Lactococcus sp. LG1267]QSR05173.1 restriction endonuclease subunit S [Lactococcus sp. LG1267]